MDQRQQRHLSRAIIVATLVAAVLLTILIKLSYASSLLLPGDRSSDSAPRDGVFDLGPLLVDANDYVAAASLAPFRAYVDATCPSLHGLDKAICISNDMAKKFPHGQPDFEFFSRQYDPAEQLRTRLAGRPGHCVTRSALAATALLSTGEPARVMQLITLQGVGHNVFEVWDHEYGWVIVDPSYGHVVFYGRNETQRKMFRLVNLPVGTAASFLDLPGALDGQRVYPEPWMYTRVGERHGGWPFRGAFVVYGYHYRRTVMIHTVLLCGTVLASAVCAALMIEWLRARRRRQAAA